LFTCDVTRGSSRLGEAWRHTVWDSGCHSDTLTTTATLESFIYPTYAQLDCSKNVKIYIKIYMRGAPTCFGFSQPSSESYYLCFAKVMSINNQLKYAIYRISSA
jgi:hypothetical protein